MRYWAAILLSTIAVAADDVAPSPILLARIKYQAAQNLERLPNYTCLETIERSMRRAGSRKFELIDVLRLEVALVNGKEMFAWPGSRQFEEQDITKLVKHGAIGNGSFALHVRGLFLSQAPRFTYVGERVRAGKDTVRYDYDVPILHSGYSLRVKPAQGVVGYRGAVWVDRKNLDLLRMEIDIYDIPPHLPVKSGIEVLEYARVKIGERDFLLPQSSELILTDSLGNENRNRTSFTGCRQFAGESVLSFEDAPAGPVEEKKAPERIEVGGGADVDLRLETAIEPGVSAVGDPLRATLTKDVRKKGQLLLPKGAVVHGRVVQMAREAGVRVDGWRIGIQWNRVEFDNKFGEFRARLNIASLPEINRGLYSSSGSRTMMVLRERPLEDPYIGILYIRGEKGKIPAGLRMYWRTEVVTVEERP